MLKEFSDVRCVEIRLKSTDPGVVAEVTWRGKPDADSEVGKLLASEAYENVERVVFCKYASVWFDRMRIPNCKVKTSIADTDKGQVVVVRAKDVGRIELSGGEAADLPTELFRLVGKEGTLTLSEMCEQPELLSQASSSG